MTFTEGILRLVQAGGRAEPNADIDALVCPEQPGAALAADLTAAPEFAPTAESFGVRLFADEEHLRATADELSALEPGASDLEAAVALVEAGIANRIVLVNFPSWPGLLWRAYQMAESSGVSILPTVVHPGGKVDILIERSSATHG